MFKKNYFRINQIHKLISMHVGMCRCNPINDMVCIVLIFIFFTLLCIVMVAAITIIFNFFIEVTIKELKEKLREFEEKTDEKLLVYPIFTAAFINLSLALEDSNLFLF